MRHVATTHRPFDGLLPVASISTLQLTLASHSIFTTRSSVRARYTSFCTLDSRSKTYEVDRPKAMRLLTLFALLPFLHTAFTQTPHARTYDTHKYYTLELTSPSSHALATSIAHSLGVELVEQVGELDGHWLVRVPGSTPFHDSAVATADPVMKRWHGLRKRSSRDLSGPQLRALTPLALRKRVKRDSTKIPARSSHSLYERDDSELLFAQNDLGIADPMLNMQWHLINQEMSDVELNVTGLWAQGITGTGVKVALIDDGLDMHSDDLADNFVSRPEKTSRLIALVCRRLLRL